MSVARQYQPSSIAELNERSARLRNLLRGWCDATRRPVSLTQAGVIVARRDLAEIEHARAAAVMGAGRS